MSLNNQITNKQSEYEKWKMYEKKIKGNLEDETAKQLNKTSEIGLILMAIKNLYDKCIDSGSHLKWRLPIENVATVNKKAETFAVKTQRAIDELNMISDYYEDFKKILGELRAAKK